MDRRQRRQVSVTVDAEFVEAGHAAVADGRAWSFSAWVNEALRRYIQQEGQLPETTRRDAGGWASASVSR